LINKGEGPIAGAPKACLGAGTGLGEVYLTHNGSNYDVWSSEGGHCDFSPRNDIEFKLLNYIRTKHGIDRVSTERVVSGLGIPDIYFFLAQSSIGQVNEENDRQIRNSQDPSSLISKLAQNDTADNGKADSLCQQAMDIFVSCYGAEAGNLALKTLPYGGLYIAGGIALKIMPIMTKGDQFLNNFLNKGRMKSVLSKIPIYLVKHTEVGLLGAKVVCRRLQAKQGVNTANDIRLTPIVLPQHNINANTNSNANSVSSQWLIMIAACVLSVFLTKKYF